MSHHLKDGRRPLALLVTTTRAHLATPPIRELWVWGLRLGSESGSGSGSEALAVVWGLELRLGLGDEGWGRKFCHMI